MGQTPSYNADGDVGTVAPGAMVAIEGAKVGRPADRDPAGFDKPHFSHLLHCVIIPPQ